MGVFKRTRINNNSKKVDFWYMRYVLNGKETWKSAGKVGEITKTVAQKMLEDIKRNIRMGTYQYDVGNVTLESLEKDYINCFIHLSLRFFAHNINITYVIYTVKILVSITGRSARY